MGKKDIEKKYEAYKNSVLDYTENSGFSYQGKQQIKQWMLCDEFKQYCLKHGNTPDCFTAVELRDMFIDKSHNKIGSKRQWSVCVQYFKGYYNYLIEKGVRPDNICVDRIISQEAYETYAINNDSIMFYSPRDIEKICGQIKNNRIIVEIIIRSLYEGIVDSVEKLATAQKGDPAFNKASNRLKNLIEEMKYEDGYFTSDGRKIGTFQYVDNYLIPTKARNEDIYDLSEEEYARVAKKSLQKTIGVAKKDSNLSLDFTRIYKSGMVYRFIDAVGGEQRFCEIVLEPNKRMKENRGNLADAQRALDEIGFDVPLKRFLFDVKIFAQKLKQKNSGVQN